MAKNLKAEIDRGLIEAYRCTIPIPFQAGEYKSITGRIVDDRAIASLMVMEV